jgi:hypothetical protein
MTISNLYVPSAAFLKGSMTAEPMAEKAAQMLSTGSPGSVYSTLNSFWGVRRTIWPVRHV